MASLQRKNDSWHIQFLYKKQRRTWVIGPVEEPEAYAIKGKVELILLRIKQHLMDVPPGMDIVDYLICDGKPKDHYHPPKPKQTTLSELRDSFVRTHENGTVEKNTLDTCKLHISHFEETIGKGFPMDALTLADLQRHVDRRSKAKGPKGKPISPVTMKKEIASLAGVWHWGCRMGLVHGEFPRGVRYPKAEEPPPFMTRQEVERAIAAGGDADELWDCLYLTLPEISELLAYVKEHAAHAFIFPMFCFAAHTGARRSEVMRARLTDLDFAGQTVLIHEKKRVRGKRSTRRVPMTPFLKEALEQWLKDHPGGPFLFCHAGTVARSKKRSKTTGHKGEKTRASGLKGRMASVRKREAPPPAALSQKEMHHHFKRTLEGSPWQVLKGWHTLRHSFISACASKGIDQRMIDDWVGHSTEEQRKRYRHLYPSSQEAAIRLVFG